MACAISGVAALFSGIALCQSAKANRRANQVSERGLRIDLVDYRMNIRNAFTLIMDEFEAQRYGPADNYIIQSKITFRDAGIFFGNDVSEFLTELMRQISTYSEIFKTRTIGRLIFDPQGYVREGANKQVISSQADSLIKISRIWADFFPANTSNQPI